MARSVLFIDHDPPSLAEVVDYLEREGHDVRAAATIAAARTAICADRPDIILVGRLPGDTSRIDCCRELRDLVSPIQTAIIMAVPPSAPRVRVRCLEEGADDVVDAPFVPPLVGARIKALSSPAREDPVEGALRYDAIVMTLGDVKVRAAGRPIPLSPTGFRLLKTFLEHPEQILSRRDLMANLGRRGGCLRSIDSQVRRLRNAMASAGFGNLIVTISSVGYMLSGN